MCIKIIRQKIDGELKQSTTIHSTQEAPCDFWGQNFNLVTSGSIVSFSGEKPLPSMIALGLFLTKQKRTLMGLREREDQTPKMLYDEISMDEDKLQVLLEVCDQVHKQFDRIIESAADA